MGQSKVDRIVQLEQRLTIALSAIGQQLADEDTRKQWDEDSATIARKLSAIHVREFK
jgi:hypothetical protein